MKRIFKALLIGFLSLGCFSLFAENYVAVGKPGKIFDEANTKYVTVNKNNNELSVMPGMVFKSFEKSPGWEMIEYSPGLRAFIQENITTVNLQEPQAGSYEIKNAPGKKVNIEKNGDSWTASDGAAKFTGTKQGQIIIFPDDTKNPVYSLVNLGGEGIVITYDNAVTNFF